MKSSHLAFLALGLAAVSGAAAVFLLNPGARPPSITQPARLPPPVVTTAEELPVGLTAPGELQDAPAAMAILPVGTVEPARTVPAASRLGNFEQALATGGAALEAALVPLREWAKQNPQECATWIAEHLEGPAKARALAEAVGLWAQDAPGAALDWLSAQGNAPGLEGAYPLALRASALQDAGTTVNWLQAHADRGSLDNWETLFSAWGESDPSAAGAWFASQVNPALHDALLPSVLASLRDDAATAALLQGTSPAVGDRALRDAAKAVTHGDPVFATHLAERIQDAGLRQAALQEVLAQWRSTNPVEAQAYAAQHGFTLPVEPVLKQAVSPQ